MSYQKATAEVLKELWQFVRGEEVESSGESMFMPVHIETGIYYGPASVMTAKLRLLLTQNFSETEMARPLQPSEYVAFVLQEAGVELPVEAKHWLAGYWHTNLKGSTGVHISVAPSKGSVMEYVDENQNGKIGIVSDVQGDEITFASVGLYKEGEYESHTLPASVWHELRPVFIHFKPNI